jgi:hypothetical protein
VPVIWCVDDDPPLRILDFDAARFDEPPGLEGLVERLPNQPLPLGRIVDVDGVPLIRLQPVKPQTRQRQNPPRQLQGRLSRSNPAAAGADIDFDQHANRCAGGGSRLRNRLGLADVVDGHLQVDPPGKLHEPRHLPAAHDLIGDQHVANAPVRQDFRLAQLRAGDAHGRTGIELAPGERHALVILEMRAELAPAATEKLRHPLQVVVRRRTVQKQRRRVEVFQRRPDPIVGGRLATN